jgi:aryl-alcohol dehydrogenase-like predicted oxidoreductase
MGEAVFSSTGSAAAPGMGTAALALPYGAPGAERPAPGQAVARRALLSALEQGVRFFDTAPAYGEAEALLGETLGAREDCVVATKLAIPAGGWSALAPAQVRTHVRASVVASLHALRRERLDVLQIHNATQALIQRGPLVPALAELRQEGLVARVGATVYGEADALAAIANPDLEVVQIAYNMLDRRPERSVLPAALAAGTAVVARSLLLHGVLTPAGRDLAGPLAALGSAAEVLRRALGVSWEDLAGAAVAFVLGRPGIAWALLGPRDEIELTALLECSRRLASVAATVGLAAPALPDRLLDPSRWPQEAPVGG